MSQDLAPVAADNSSLVNIIERAARDPDIDVSKLERLIELQRDVTREQDRRAFNIAMANAQAEMMPVLRDATNPHSNSRYAKLETIDRAMRPLYTKHGFSVRFGSAPSPKPEWIRITCTIAHRGGYYEDHYLDSPLDLVGSKGTQNKTAVQGVGSTVSYLRRYLLLMAFNIVLADQLEDDDGEATRPDPLDEPNGTLWLRNFLSALEAATSLEELQRINQHPFTVKALAKAPTLVKTQITDALNKAFERFAAKADKQQSKRPTDALQAALHDVEHLTLPELEEINNNAWWTSRLGELFPPDSDQVWQKIELRKAELARAAAKN